jgi:hypothetical protein
MSLKEMLPSVRTLPRTDKLRLMQFLAAELAQEGSESLLTSGGVYPIYTPQGIPDSAAETLAAYLKQTGHEA